MDRKCYPGIDDLIKSGELDGVVGKVVNKIREKYKERNTLVRRVEERFTEWNKLFTELNRLDGELDALELIALEESENCDIINKIVEGAKIANKEKMDQINKAVKKSSGYAQNIGGPIGAIGNPFGIRRR